MACHHEMETAHTRPPMIAVHVHVIFTSANLMGCPLRCLDKQLPRCLTSGLHPYGPSICAYVFGWDSPEPPWLWLWRWDAMAHQARMAHAMKYSARAVSPARWYSGAQVHRLLFVI